MTHTKTFETFGSILRDPDKARIHPVVITQYAADASISKTCFPLRVTSSKLACTTAAPTIGGERPGVKWVATSKPSTSTCLTLLLGHEGRVESNRYQSHGNATDIVATRFVPNEYNPNRCTIGVWVETIVNVFTHVAGASWVMTKNYICNCRFNPSHVSTPILRPLTS